MLVKCAFVACLLLVWSPEAFSASPFGGLLQLNNFLIKVKELAHLNSKSMVNPAKCLNDTQQTETTRFMNCQRVFTNDPAGSHISPTQARTFCLSGCPSYLSNLLHRFIEDCDIPSNQRPGVAAFMLLSQSCAASSGANSNYCIETWQNLNSTIAANPSYLNCFKVYDGHTGTCPTVCKTAEKWVISQFGCCYRALEDYATHDQLSEEVLTDDYWNSCGLKPPSLCPSP